MTYRGQQRQTYSPTTLSKTADSQACNKVPEYRSKLEGPHRGFASNKVTVGLTCNKGFKNAQEVLFLTLCSTVVRAISQESDSHPYLALL